MLSGDPNQAPRNIELSRARSTQAACIVSIGSTPPRRTRAVRTAVIDPAEAPPIASTRSGGSLWSAQVACTAVKSAARAPASYAPRETAPDIVRASLSFPMNILPFLLSRHSFSRRLTLLIVFGVTNELQYRVESLGSARDNQTSHDGVQPRRRCRRTMRCQAGQDAEVSNNGKCHSHSER